MARAQRSSVEVSLYGGGTVLFLRYAVGRGRGASAILAGGALGGYKPRHETGQTEGGEDIQSVPLSSFLL